MTAAAPRIWHVSVRGNDSTADVADRASARGWETIHTECVRLASGSGRVIDVVQRGDAVRLYEDMHRRPVAVVYNGKPRVRLDPRPPLRDDRTVSLLQFCRYKSFAVSFRSNAAATWDSVFDNWVKGVECDGSNDPRVLPFHLFAAKGSYELDVAAERRRFRRSHQHRRALVDQLRRRWASAAPGARHGRNPQMVRGLRLDDGFHWDVTTASSKAISSSSTIWTVRAGGYINIYPDGHIRVGKQCSQTWSAKKSAAADEDDRKRSLLRK